MSRRQSDGPAQGGVPEPDCAQRTFGRHHRLGDHGGRDAGSGQGQGPVHLQAGHGQHGSEAGPPAGLHCRLPQVVAVLEHHQRHALQLRHPDEAPVGQLMPGSDRQYQFLLHERRRLHPGPTPIAAGSPRPGRSRPPRDGGPGPASRPRARSAPARDARGGRRPAPAAAGWSSGSAWPRWTGGPAAGPAGPAPAAAPASQSASTWRAQGRNASPAPVSTTSLRARWNSGAPSSCSRAATALLTDGCATCRRAAARVKRRSSATHTT